MKKTTKSAVWLTLYIAGACLLVVAQVCTELYGQAGFVPLRVLNLIANVCFLVGYCFCPSLLFSTAPHKGPPWRLFWEMYIASLACYVLFIIVKFVPAASGISPLLPLGIMTGICVCNAFLYRTLMLKDADTKAA